MFVLKMFCTGGIDEDGRSGLLVGEYVGIWFVEQRFVKEHVETLTTAGRRHYKDTLKHVVGAFGEIPLRDLKKYHVQRLLIMKAERGLSKSYLTQIRNTIHTVYQYAEDCEFYTGRNPARRVKIPANARRPHKITGYSLEQFRAVIAELQSPLREMFLLGAATSMHGAELAGLRICHLNLSDQAQSVKGETLTPGSLLVCENVYRNRRGDTKNEHRRRKLPIPPALRSRIAEMVAGRDENEPVFLMPATARRSKVAPVDTHNVQNRVLRPLGKRLGFPVSWHRVRHSNATWTHEMFADDKDRAAMMGHWSAAMTDHYTDHFERRRRLAEAIESRVMGEAVGGVN